MSIIFVGQKEFPESPNTLIFSPEKGSIGIENVRDGIRFLSVGKDRILVFKSAESLTEEAQNSLLKTLEEPPGNAQIYLVTKNADLLLPTIRSRCEIVIGDKIAIESSENIQKIDKLSISEKISLAKTKSSSRESALSYIDDLLTASHKDLNTKNVRALFMAKKHLNANTNVRLVLENLLLNW